MQFPRGETFCIVVARFKIFLQISTLIMSFVSTQASLYLIAWNVEASVAEISFCDLLASLYSNLFAFSPPLSFLLTYVLEESN